MANTTIVRHVTEALLGILRHDLSDAPPSPIVTSSNIKAAPPEDSNRPVSRRAAVFPRSARVGLHGLSVRRVAARVGIFADVGLVIAMTPDGGILEGRAG